MAAWSKPDLFVWDRGDRRHSPLRSKFGASALNIVRLLILALAITTVPEGAALSQTAPLRPFPLPNSSPIPVFRVPADATVEEQQCFGSVQSKIAWNQAGSTQWWDNDIWDLCKGTRYPDHRLTCFKNEVVRVDDFHLAILACQTAEASLRPAQPAITQGSVPAACRNGLPNPTLVSPQDYDACLTYNAVSPAPAVPADPPSKADHGILPTLNLQEQTCHDRLQDHVAIDDAGNTHWRESDLRLLCTGTPNGPWTVGCYRQSFEQTHHYFEGAVRVCNKSTQDILRHSIPAPGASPAAVGMSRSACSQVLGCFINTVQGFSPVDVCASCGSPVSSPAQSTVSAFQNLVESPSFYTACGTVDQLFWLSQALNAEGAINTIVSGAMCAVNSSSSSLCVELH